MAPTRRRLRWHTLRLRMAVLVVVTALVAAGIAAALTLGMLSRLATRLDAAQSAMASTVAAALDQDVLRSLSRLQGLATAWRSAAADQPARAQEELHRTVLSMSVIDAVLILDRAAAVVAVDGECIAALGPGTARAAALEVITSGAPAVSDIVDVPWGCGPAAAETPAILMLVPIVDWQGRPIGAVCGVARRDGHRLASLGMLLVEHSSTPMALVDGNQRVIVAPTTSAATAVVGGKVVLAPVTAGRSRWTVRLHVPPTTRSAGSLVAAFGWLVTLTLGLGLLLAWGASRSVVQPLTALTRAAERIAGGSLDGSLPPLSGDEVGRLGRAFDEMRLSLKASRDRVAAAQAELEARVQDRTRELQRANRQLAERDAVRATLLRKVITAQEEERKRLARELHDETAQTVTALGIRLDAALATTAPGPAHDALNRARELATRTLDELHRLMHDLRPSVLDDLGLVAAIRWHAERHLVSKGVGVRFEIEDAETIALAPEVETAVFRAVQEVLSNIERHAHADAVLVQIACTGGKLLIEVEDDGVGFSPEDVVPSPRSARGLGLMGLRERIELAGGTLVVDSSPGRGTRVLLGVPMEPVHAG